VTGGDVSVTNGACLAPAVAARWWAAAWGGFGAQVLKCHGGDKRYEAWLLEKRFVQFWTLLVKGGSDPVVFFKAG